MATVHVAWVQVQDRALTGATLPSPDAHPMASEVLTSGAASAAGTIATTSAEGFWIVTVKGGAVLAGFGAAPTADDHNWLILDGQTRDFAVGAAGEKIAIKDAA
jgi:hypothetical protein